MNSQNKVCQSCKIKFTIEPEDFKFYEKIGVPAPTFCPECRMIRRMAFRFERQIYKRKDDYNGKVVFSRQPTTFTSFPLTARATMAYLTSASRV